MCGALVVSFLHGTPIAVGNQALQFVWIRHLQSPELFAADNLIASFDSFPSLFFPAIAALLPKAPPFSLVFPALQVLNLFFLSICLVLLARSIFPKWRYPLLTLVFLVPGWHALAETPLPFLTFTHTSFGLSLSVLVLALFYRGNVISACGILGALTNIHLLTAAYTGAILAVWVFLTVKEQVWRRLVAGGLLFAVLSLPVLVHLFAQGHEWDGVWLGLLRLRSAHHVFPSTWWQEGDESWGRFSLIVCWVAWSTSTLNREELKRWLPWFISPALLMILGTLGAEWMPTPLVLRAQLFRSSMYVLLALLVILPVALTRLALDGGMVTRCLVVLSAASCAFPAGTPFQFPLLLLLVAASWWRGTFRVGHALGFAIGCSLLIFSDILLHTALTFPRGLPSGPILGGVLACILIGALVAATGANRPSLSRTYATLGLVLVPVFVWHLPDPEPSGTNDWEDIQHITKSLTPEDAKILTPSRQSGFRLHSERAIVGEWRDGTMQFFDPDFAISWYRSQHALRPEATRRFTADDWIEAAAKHDARYIVLPQGAGSGLVRIDGNRSWDLYRAKLVPRPPLPSPPPNAIDPSDWLAQAKFLRDVVDPGIQRHRISRIRLRLINNAGQPLAGLPVRIEQSTRHFKVGSALHHFNEVTHVGKQFRAPLNQAEELARFREVFN